MEKIQENSLEAADSYLSKGKELLGERKFEEAITLIQEAISMYEETGSQKELADAYATIGVVYGAYGDENKAVDYYLKGLAVAEEQALFHLCARNYNNIGNELQKKGVHNKAIEYFIKGVNELKHVNPDRYSRRNVAMACGYLNIGLSYTELGKYDDAMVSLENASLLLETEETDELAFDILITECRIKWAVGDKNFVYKHIDEICQELVAKASVTDYVSEMEEVCALLKVMGEYDRWKTVLKGFEEQNEEHNGYYYSISCVEWWLDYYKTTKQQEKYTEACVRHTELYMKQKQESQGESADNIEAKIELYKKEKERRAAEAASNIDNLTGLFNRHKLESDYSTYARDEDTIAIGLGIIDVDCFKEQNDTFGHVAGDECLKKIAFTISQSVGDNATVYRYGGDEFVLLFKNKSYDVIRIVAEKIKENIIALEISNATGHPDKYMTVSQGYIIRPGIENSESIYPLVKLADKELYRVKNAGRNDYKISRGN